MTDLQKLCNANVLPKKITIPKPEPQSAYDVERMLEDEEDDWFEDDNPCSDYDDCDECPYYEESGEGCTYDYPD